MVGRSWVCVVVVLPALACASRSIGSDDVGEQATQTSSESETETETETESGTETETGAPASECGNGLVEADEQCDDGNTSNSDGCVAGCSLAVCGDGFKYVIEECDDGNDVDDDECSNACEYNVHPLCLDQSLPQLDSMTRDYLPDGPGGVQLCDQTGAPNQSPDWVGPGWYRYGDYFDFVIPFSPVEDYGCGGTAGGWLNSELPSIADGPTDVEICFGFGDEPCAWSVDAVMINCWIHTNVLWLPEVPDCDLRYCIIQLVSP